MTLIDWLRLFAKGQFRQPELNAFQDWLEEKGDDRAKIVVGYCVKKNMHENRFLVMEGDQLARNALSSIFMEESDAWVHLGEELVIYLLRTEE